MEFGFSCFGHNTPGVSNRIMPLPKLMRCWLFVTAGSLPVLAMIRSARILISVDLPTFGIPVIIAFIDFTDASFCSQIVRIIDMICLLLVGSSVVVVIVFTPRSFSKCACHLAVNSGSAKSYLLRILRQGLSPRIFAISGFSLE